MQINVLEYLDCNACRLPDKIALNDCSTSFTFAEWITGAKRIASAIIARYAPDIRKPVAVYLPKSADCLVAFMGVLYSGNFYAPLDMHSPSERIQTILSNLNPLAVLTHRKYKTILTAIGINEQNIVLLDELDDCPIDESALKRRRNQIIDTDPVYAIYTSGSTGTPKGVVISHRGVIDYIDWAIGCFGVNEQCTIGNQSPFYFDNSTLDIYLCAATGATLVIIPEQLFAFPVKLIEYVRQKGVNFIFWVPFVMIHIANLKALDSEKWPGLKSVLFAGEVMPNRQLNYWRRCIPDALYANLYGPTEITVDCTYFIVDREFRDDEPLPIGFPCRNSDILILNERNQPAKSNEPGELCVRGSSLALGYWNDPEKTANSFVQNPLNRHYPERIYRTGDLVTKNERNEIIFIGRKDSQIKHLGYRIELGEIELASASMEGIDAACVLYNQDKKEITLFFESKLKIAPAEIRRYLMKSLPKYMAPTVFHQLESMPRNPNGKIDRPQLVSAYCK